MQGILARVWSVMDSLDIQCLISGKETNNQVSVFSEIVAPKSGPPLHTHEHQLEIFHVISGRILFEVDGERTEIPAGGVATIQSGVPHRFINEQEDPAEIHFELLPSGDSEAFFDRLVGGDFDDPPTFFERHGLQLLGPPLQ